MTPAHYADVARMAMLARLILPVYAQRQGLAPITLALGTRACTDIVDSNHQAIEDDAAFERLLASLDAALGEEP